MSAVGNGTDDIARIDSDPCEDDAPTRVGPMSPGVVAKLMDEAERESVKGHVGPPSGIRRSWASGLEANDAPRGDRTKRRPSSSNLVDAIVDEMVGLEDADLEVQPRSSPPPLPPRVSTNSGPSTRWQQPRPAAFPEWIGRTSEPVVQDRTRAVRVFAAAGGCIATLTLIVWWLFA